MPGNTGERTQSKKAFIQKWAMVDTNGVLLLVLKFTKDPVTGLILSTEV